MAKQAPELQAVDFLSLGQWQAYVNLTAGGAPSGWALVRTLPPPEPTGLGEQIRTLSRDRYASDIPTYKTAAEPQPSAVGQDEAISAELGRIRRRS